MSRPSMRDEEIMHGIAAEGVLLRRRPGKQSGVSIVQRKIRPLRKITNNVM